MGLFKNMDPKKKGSLHKMLNIPKGKKIPFKTLSKATHSRSPLEQKKANWALNVRKSTHRGQR